MANRVTEAEVENIADIDSSDDVSAFITTANLLVTEELSDKDDLSTDRLKQIELWLSAHFAKIKFQAAASEGAEDVSQSFQYKLGLNLQSTMWGQQAILLDTTGTLAAMSEKGKVPTVMIEDIFHSDFD